MKSSLSVAPREECIDLESVMEPVKGYLRGMNDYLESQKQYFEPEIHELVDYVLRNKGKQLRPMLVYYSGWHGRQDEAIMKRLTRVAAVVELVHLATLVHDDVIDGAEVRHGEATLDSKCGGTEAILLGDALFAHALRVASDFPTTLVCRLVSESIRRVCAGEIIQNFAKGQDGLSLEKYFKIIELKTGELCSLACLLGGENSGAKREYVEGLSSFGRNFGIAYQILDDVMDIVADPEHADKTLRTDVMNGRYTLPLLLLYQRLSGVEKGRLKLMEGEEYFRVVEEMLVEHEVWERVMQVFKGYLDRGRNALISFEGKYPVDNFIGMMKFLEGKMYELLGGRI